MRLAYIILCHKGTRQVERLIDRLSSPNVSFVLHVSKTSEGRFAEEIKERLKGKANVYWAKRENGAWGEFGIVQAVLNCLAELKNSRVEYSRVTVLSGQDYPVYSPKQIQQFFESNADKEFLRYWKFYPLQPDDLKDYPWTTSKHLQHKRLTHHYLKVLGKRYAIPEKYNDRYYKHGLARTLLDFMGNIPEYIKRRKLRDEAIVFLLTRIMPRQKKLPDIQFYGGSQWWSITAQAAQYLLDFDEKDKVLKKFYKTALLADESYFQTVLMNSSFKEKVVNDNLRYIVFVPGNMHPKVLVHHDYEDIKKSGKMFARKLELPQSADLMESIEYDWKNE